MSERANHTASKSARTHKFKIILWQGAATVGKETPRAGKDGLETAFGIFGRTVHAAQGPCDGL